MGLEIDRARALLAALTREELLSEEDANAAYESWVAQSESVPFSRYLIDTARAESGTVRLLLRRQAVQGLPSPDLFTYERFEDLLIGQLGIEAGMLSAKLLQTVRAVQDKKVAEGKLRRLADLLPRAGYDRELLELLEQHLGERVLLCKGCLGRYPRKDLGDVTTSCPRCGAPMSADPLEPSGVTEMTPEQRKMLLASSECVLETISVSQREGSAPRPRKTQQPVGPPPAAVFVALIVMLAVVGGILYSMLSGPNRRQGPQISPRTSPTWASSPSPSASQPDSNGAPSLARARQEDLRLLREGKIADLISVWKAVTAGPGEDKKTVSFAKERRIEELQALQRLATKLGAVWDRVEKDPKDTKAERELTRLLVDSPKHAPFRNWDAALAKRHADRVAAAGVEANRRYTAALDQGAPQLDVWDQRLQRASRRTLLGVRLEGRRVDGVKVEAMGETGFKLQTPAGVLSFPWAQHPSLSLQVMVNAADAASREDQVELLRLALVARNLPVAQAALARLEVPAGTLDPTEVIAQAPTSMPIESTGPIERRHDFPIAWQPHDLTLSQGTTITTGKAASGLLLLEGAPCGLTSAGLPLNIPKDRKAKIRVAVSCEVEPQGRDTYLALLLDHKGKTRRYLGRWSKGKWSLEVDFGSGTNPLKRGKTSKAVERARLEFTGREVTLTLGNLVVASTPLSRKSFEKVAVGLGGVSGPLKVRQLRIDAPLDDAWLQKREQSYANVVLGRIDELVVATAGSSGAPTAGFSPLSVEDPRELAPFSESVLGRLEKAKDQLLAGKHEAAAVALRKLELEQPDLLAARYYRAYAALLGGDISGATASLNGALDKRSEFVEAIALKGLAMAMAGRGPLANDLCEEVRGVRPDLAPIHLARARGSSLIRDLARPLARGVLRGDLSLARALAPNDPLVDAQVRAINRSARLEESFSHRYHGRAHVVLSRSSEAEAKAIAEKLDGLVKPMERALGNHTPRPVLVLLLPSVEFEAIVGPGADTQTGFYAPDLDLLLLNGAPPEETPRTLAVAVSAAYVAHRYGAPPPWLETGVVEFLATAASKLRPDHYVKAIQDSRGWGPANWTELFEMNRSELRSSTVARARSWTIVANNKPARFKSLLKKAQEGKRWSTVPNALAPEKLESQMGKFLRKLKKDKN